MNFERELTKRIEQTMSTWDDKNTYAVSFLVTANELSSYRGVKNFFEVSIGYNTEQDCEYAPIYSEERWNYAFWSQNNTTIVSSVQTDMADLLLEWYQEQGVTNIGVEIEKEMYDEQMNYIGKGPCGYIELLQLLSDIARKIQTREVLKSRFGNIPIIVHDLEYSWYVFDATKNANPNGEAEAFLKALSNDFSD